MSIWRNAATLEELQERAARYAHRVARHPLHRRSARTSCAPPCRSMSARTSPWACCMAAHRWRLRKRWAARPPTCASIPSARYASGQEINANHLRPVCAGTCDRDGALPASWATAARSGRSRSATSASGWCAYRASRWQWSPQSQSEIIECGASHAGADGKPMRPRRQHIACAARHSRLPAAAAGRRGRCTCPKRRRAS